MANSRTLNRIVIVNSMINGGKISYVLNKHNNVLTRLLALKTSSDLVFPSTVLPNTAAVIISEEYL